MYICANICTQTIFNVFPTTSPIFHPLHMYSDSYSNSNSHNIVRSVMFIKLRNLGDNDVGCNCVTVFLE